MARPYLGWFLFTKADKLDKLFLHNQLIKARRLNKRNRMIYSSIKIVFPSHQHILICGNKGSIQKKQQEREEIDYWSSNTMQEPKTAPDTAKALE